MEDAANSAMGPVLAFALVGVLGVGSQWFAWRLKLPAIVLMLIAGFVVGPILGIFDPERDIGELYKPMIQVAVAVILFEGGLTLNFHSLRDAATGVKRLVFVGAPLGWAVSTLALKFGAGLTWESSVVLGGLMIITGPTVIAPLLRTARLQRRPSALLQWEAIANDPLGAMAAVLALEFVLVRQDAESIGGAVPQLAVGLVVAIALGVAAGYGVSWAFKRAKVPEFMKVPVLFVVMLTIFAVCNAILHESGLLAVTIMGVVIANAGLASFDELRRFKEHATILLVSGVFILLAASVELGELAALSWRAIFFVALVILFARPLTVYIALMFSHLPWRERTLVALTGPRGVVLVAVAGLFGERLASVGVEDGMLLGPLAFVLVAGTVVFHGFTLGPLARRLNLTASATPGVIFVGGSRWTTALASALKEADIPVLVCDPNRSHLRRAREAGLRIFFGDLLSIGAERRIELQGYKTIVAATDNDAYNTLVATETGSEFGRDNVYQVGRDRGENDRYALPATIGGRTFADGSTYNELNRLIWRDWRFSITRLSEEYDIDTWRKERPEAKPVAWIDTQGEIFFVNRCEDVRAGPGVRMVAMIPPQEQDESDEVQRAA